MFYKIMQHQFPSSSVWNAVYSGNSYNCYTKLKKENNEQNMAHNPDFPIYSTIEVILILISFYARTISFTSALNSAWL